MKLDKKQGWDLVRTMLTSWMIRENILADVEDVVDNYVADIGEEIFLLALDWKGGMSSQEREKFNYQMSVRDWHSSLNDNYQYEDEYDVTMVSDAILHLTQQLKKFIDVEIKPNYAEIYEVTVTQPVTTSHFKCPYCSHENNLSSYNRHPRQSKCSNCKIDVLFR